MNCSGSAMYCKRVCEFAQIPALGAHAGLPARCALHTDRHCTSNVNSSL